MDAVVLVGERTALATARKAKRRNILCDYWSLRSDAHVAVSEWAHK